MKRCAASPALVRVWNGFAGELDRITIPRFGLWKTQRVGLSAPSRMHHSSKETWWSGTRFP